MTITPLKNERRSPPGMRIDELHPLKIEVTPTGTGVEPLPTSPLAMSQESSIKVTLSQTHGQPGSSVMVSGTVTPPPTSSDALVRILFRDCDFTTGLVEAPVGRNGRFSQVVAIPAEAEVGSRAIIIVGGRGIIIVGGRPVMTEAPFIVDPLPPSPIIGKVTIRLPNGQLRPEPGVRVSIFGRVTDRNDNLMPIIAETTTDSAGSFLANIPPNMDLSCGFAAAAKEGFSFEAASLNFQRRAKSDQSLSIVGKRFNPPGDLVPFDPSVVPMFAKYEKSARGSLSCELVDIGQFASMIGRGIPVSNSFAAVLPFVVPSGYTVHFVFSEQHGRLRATSTDGVRWIAGGADMSEFRASHSSITVHVEVSGEGVTKKFSPSLEFSVQDVPWFNDWMVQRKVKFNETARRYEFSATLPGSPAFSFNEPLNLPGITLDNSIGAGIPVTENLNLDGSWSGTARMILGVTLLGLNVADSLGLPYNQGPKKYYVSRSHAFKLDRVPVAPQLQGCADIPGLHYQAGGSFTIVGRRIGFGFFISAKICQGVLVEAESEVMRDLRTSLGFNLHLQSSLPITFEILFGPCGGEASISPKVDACVRVQCDTRPCRVTVGNGCGICYQLRTDLDYRIQCFGITIYKGRAGIGLLEWPRCIGNESSAEDERQAADVAPLSPTPTVASDGNGRALAVWIQDQSANPSTPDRRLYFSSYDGNAWSSAARLSQDRVLVEAPQVAFYGPSRAVAVWSQSKLSLQEALMSSPEAILTSGELYYALWDGRQWGRPAPITNDDLMDGAPSLAADPESGRMIVGWNRFNTSARPNQDPLALYYSSFDGTRWSAPALMDVNSTTQDSQLKVAFDRRGQAVAVWLRDADHDALTSADRQLVMSRLTGQAWSAPEAIPNLPAGAFSPSLAFDTKNNPILAFVVPPVDQATGAPTSGVGNQNALYAAYRRGAAWEVTPVGQKTYAERPTVKVNAENQAIIMYRQFGADATVHSSGDLAAAATDLNASSLQWATGYLTADGMTNWQVAFDIDQKTSKNFVVSVKQSPGGTGATNAEVAEALSLLAKGEHVEISEVVALGRNHQSLNSRAQAQSGPSIISRVVPYAVDLRVTPENFAASETHPVEGERVTITATVRNVGLKATPNQQPFTVKFYDGAASGGRLLHERQITTPLRFSASAVASFSYTVSRGGLQTITAVVDQENAVMESDEQNNTTPLTFGQMPPPMQLFVDPDPEQKVMSLGWSAPETKGIDHYEIFRSTTTGRDYEFVGETTATEFVDNLVRPGVTYYYVVIAVDVYGTRSVFSNEALAKLDRE